ncbi:MAG: hypothetical protein RR495_07625 [Anaerovoracaceae bacterium]
MILLKKIANQQAYDPNSPYYMMSNKTVAVFNACQDVIGYTNYWVK